TYRQRVLEQHAAIKPKWDPDVDYGDLNLHFELTDAGKAEWLRRRGPTPDEYAWMAEFGKGSISFRAKTEDIALRIAEEALRRDYDGKPRLGNRISVPCACELKSGDKI